MVDTHPARLVTLVTTYTCLSSGLLLGVQPNDTQHIEHITEQLTIWREAIRDTPGIRAVLQDLSPEQHAMMATVIRSIYPGAILDAQQQNTFESLPFFVKEELWPYVTYDPDNRKDT